MVTIPRLLHFFPLLSVVFYLLSTGAYLRAYLNRDSETKGLKVGKRCLIVALFAHLAFLALEISGGYRSLPLGSESFLSVIGLPLSLSLVSIFVSSLFIALERKMNLSALGVFVSPLSLLFMILSSVFFHLSVEPTDSLSGGPLLWIHIGSAVLANVFLVFAFGISLAVIVKETALKRKRAILKPFPSLIELDRLNSFVVGIGFVLMGTGIISGLAFAFLSDVNGLVFDPRVLWSILTFLVYAFLLVARFGHGWRGRRVAWLAIAGFTTIMASFVSINLMGNTFHLY